MVIVEYFSKKFLQFLFGLIEDFFKLYHLKALEFIGFASKFSGKILNFLSNFEGYLLIFAILRRLKIRNFVNQN